MTPIFLRALQAAIMARPACVALAITPEMGKVPVEQAVEADRQIAALLNADGYAAGSQEVPAWWAKRLLAKRGKWVDIEDAAADRAHPGRKAAATAVALAESQPMQINFLDPASGPLMEGLIAAGLMSADDRQALEDMSRTDSQITADQVSRALRGPWGDE